MDKSFYSSILNGIENLLKEKGYHRTVDADLEYFTNGERAVTVEYDEKDKLLRLKNAVLEEGSEVKWNEMSAWFLDENSTEADKKSIENDFVDSLSELIGVKTSTLINQQQVDLPSKRAKADTIDIEGMTARFLAMYPVYKDAYKENVAVYGDFLYDKFFTDYAVPELRKALQADNKKQINKQIDLYNTCYLKGDEAVVTTVVYTVLGGALLGDAKLAENAWAYMDKAQYLKSAVQQMLKVLSSEKNRKKYL